MKPAAPPPSLVVPLLIIFVSLVLRFVPGRIAPNTLVHFMTLGLGPLIGVLGVLLWCIFGRRISWRDGWVGAGAAFGVLVLVGLVSHPTMVLFLFTYGLPLALGLLGIAFVLTRSWPWSRRRYLLAASLALAMLPSAMFRMDGQGGDLTPQLSARWAPTAEGRFLANRPTPANVEQTTEGALASVASDWPGFRGPTCDGRVSGVVFRTDWGTAPPRELWRRRIGPAWSSFAVAGGMAFTQEQRGDDEAVVAYALADGAEVWELTTRERFEEPQGGPGPRATPTFAGGRIYTLGAGGTVQGIDATTGRRLWRRGLVQDLEAPIPPWGFSSSPLVVDRAVIVLAGATGGRSVVAYDIDSGDMLWTAGEGTQSYASAQPANIGGVEQVLIATDVGLQSLAPRDGALLWEYRWPISQPRIVQPAVLEASGSVILPTGYGEGTRRIDVHREAGGSFEVREIWQSRSLKPYFNDAVCHRDHCYGFDDRIFTCIGISDGERCWKGGRYGYGQVLLLVEMDLLLVMTDAGTVVLLDATPDALREVARFEALSGKTWSHPVITDGKLLVRNAEEAACFELPRADAGSGSAG